MRYSVIPPLMTHLPQYESSIKVPQEVLLAQFSLNVHKGGLQHHSFHFIAKYLQYDKIIIIANTSK